MRNFLGLAALLITFSSSSGLLYGRNFASQQARFTSPDPIAITKIRMVDPQQFNLYSYARCNPLMFIDPTGEDITVTGGQGMDQTEYKNLLQTEITSFQIDINGNGKIGVVGNVDPSTLSGNDKKLYDEITDQKDHVTVALTRDDPNVDFGRFDGGGKQTVDLSDIEKLNSPSNKGGLSPAEVITHETYEPFAGLTKNFTQGQDAHLSINSFFPGFNLTARKVDNLIRNSTNMVEQQTYHTTIDGGSRKNTKVDITLKVATPVPPRTNLPVQPGHVSNVKVVP